MSDALFRAGIRRPYPTSYQPEADSAFAADNGRKHVSRLEVFPPGPNPAAIHRYVRTDRSGHSGG